MLKEYSGYDLLTEQGLRDWQKFAIEKVARTQPKSMTDLGFRKGKKLTPKQRKEPQESREEGECITLAVDVSYKPIPSNRYKADITNTG